MKGHQPESHEPTCPCSGQGYIGPKGKHKCNGRDDLKYAYGVSCKTSEQRKNQYRAGHQNASKPRTVLPHVRSKPRRRFQKCNDYDANDEYSNH